MGKTRGLACALCAPAVRMVVVEASVWCEGETAKVVHTIYPVVAIESVVSGEEERRTALIVDGLGIAAYDSEARTTTTRCSEIVVAPWPPEEDEQRLAELIAYLEHEATEGAKREAKRKQDRRSQKAGEH